MLKRHGLKTALLLLIMTGLNGCSFFIDSASRDFANQFKQTLLNHNDPDTVAEALPAYLLMLEALQKADDDKAPLLLATANLYGSYLSLLPDTSPRKQPLSRKALDFALRGACVDNETLCGLQQKNPAELQAISEQVSSEDLDSLYSVGAAWAGWIQAHKNDWNAVAQLAQVKLLMARVLTLDPSYQQGNAHLYLAVLESLAPPALGGRPEVAKQHFEQAMRLSPRNLIAPVLYAKHYARMVFDRELHDNLLKSALAADPNAPELTLINTLAQQQAQQLLDSANDYF